MYMLLEKENSELLLLFSFSLNQLVHAERQIYPPLIVGRY